MKRILAIAVLVLAGCGSDSTGPNNTTNVSGRWTFAASNLSGSGASCSLSGVVMQLTQSGTTFSGATVQNTSGTYGHVSCTAGGQSIFNDNITSSDQIASGTINGTAVTFDIGTSDIHNSGTVSGSSISGTTTFRFSDGTNLVGNFSMVKQ